MKKLIYYAVIFTLTIVTLTACSDQNYKADAQETYKNVKKNINTSPISGELIRVNSETGLEEIVFYETDGIDNISTGVKDHTGLILSQWDKYNNKYYFSQDGNKTEISSIEGSTILNNYKNEFMKIFNSNTRNPFSSDADSTVEKVDENYIGRMQAPGVNGEVAVTLSEDGDYYNYKDDDIIMTMYFSEF